MGPVGDSGEELLPSPLPCCFPRAFAGPPCAGTFGTGFLRSLHPWVQSLLRRELVNQAPKHPSRRRVAGAGAASWVWVHWSLV